MNTSNLATGIVLDDRNFEKGWIALYLLLPLAKHWVYAAHIYSWIGQENDIAWDIVLVTIQRMYEYNLKVQSENIPIASLQRLSITIAKNYFQDLRRKDYRLQPLDRDGYSQVERSIHDETNTAEAVLDKIHNEWLFHELAHKMIAIHHLNSVFPGVTFNVTHISSSEPFNVVPDAACCHISVQAFN